MAKPPISYIFKIVLGLILLIPIGIYLGVCGLYHLGNRACEAFSKGMKTPV